MSGQETAHSGLLDGTEYRPDAIGAARIEAGEPEQTWPQYGLEMVPILHDGSDTGRRFIRQNGNYIADVTDEYQLLPNEEVVEVANQVARDLGAEPFHHFGENAEDWYIPLDDHVYQDPERRRVHALYAWEKGFVGGDDAVEYGFAVHNSIDSSQAFSVALFSFRHACANMVHIGTGGYREAGALGVEGERDVLHSEKHKHTKGLEIGREELTALVKSNLVLVNHVDEAYNQWQSEVVTTEMVEELLRKRLPNKELPEWVQAAQEDLDAEREERREHDDQAVILPDDLRADIIEAKMPSGEAVWDTYNDLTEAIWHNDQTADNTKPGRMDKVHQVFNPLQTVGDD